MVTDAEPGFAVICRAVSLSLEQGNCDGSCVAYVLLGKIARSRFGDYQAGYRFGQLGYELVERRGLKRFRGQDLSGLREFSSCDGRSMCGPAAIWCVARSKWRTETGDLTYAAYACTNLNRIFSRRRSAAARCKREAEQGLAFAQKARFGLVIDAIATQLGLVRTLRGLTPKFGCFDEWEFNELRIEDHLSSNPALALAGAGIGSGNCRRAISPATMRRPSTPHRRRNSFSGHQRDIFEEAEYHFYSALARAASCDSAPVDERQQHLDALAAHHRQLRSGPRIVRRISRTAPHW